MTLPDAVIALAASTLAVLIAVDVPVAVIVETASRNAVRSAVTVPVAVIALDAVATNV